MADLSDDRLDLKDCSADEFIEWVGKITEDLSEAIRKSFDRDLQDIVGNGYRSRFRDRDEDGVPHVNVKMAMGQLIDLVVFRDNLIAEKRKAYLRRARNLHTPW